MTLVGAPFCARAADARLLDAARAAEPAVIKTLGELVSIESGSAEHAGLERIATYAETRLRALGAQTERVTASVGKSPIVKAVPDTEVSVDVTVGRPAFVANDRGRALARRAQAVYAELEGKSLYLAENTGGGTDAAFAAASGKVAVLEGLGLAGFGYHARDEYIEIDSIVPPLYLLMRLLQEFDGNGP